MSDYAKEIPEIEIRYKYKPPKTLRVISSRVAAEALYEFFNKDTIQYSEEVVLIVLNRHNKCLGWIRISQGGLSGTVVDPKMVFGVCLKAGASSFLLGHNHPSGHMRPSEQDLHLTRQLCQGAKILDLTFLDHIILAPSESGQVEDYYSFADNGQLHC